MKPDSKTLSKAWTPVVLTRGETGHTFSVKVGSGHIMAFSVAPRQVDEWRDTPRTVRKDHAVFGWRTGVLSGTRSWRGSLLELANDLADYGLSAEPVLACATERGWPDNIVEEARKQANDIHEHRKQQAEIATSRVAAILARENAE